MLKCARAGVDVPAIYFVDAARSRIFMERIDGSTVKQLLWSSQLDAAAVSALMTKIGDALACVHAADLVHMDLTTSNM